MSAKAKVIDGSGKFPQTLGERLRRFQKLSPYEKSTGIGRHWRSFFPKSYVLLRLPTRVWWLACHSSLDDRLLHATEMEFEGRELKLVEKLLQPGMTVVDIGAHHGLYSTLASRLVGRRGRVVAFEPSPRERRRLRANVLLNGASNISLESFALGSEDGEAVLHLVQGQQDWCNSLRPPTGVTATRPVRVKVKQLDEFAKRLNHNIDFIKLDAEGGELEILKGAKETLSRSRATILIEVEDIRTQAWGYKSSEIVKFLSAMKYRWFAIERDGRLMEIAGASVEGGNYLAVPEEKLNLVASIVIA